MIKNYIAVISPLVGLRGLGSTSFIYSQVFALVFFPQWRCFAWLHGEDG